MEGSIEGLKCFAEGPVYHWEEAAESLGNQFWYLCEVRIHCWYSGQNNHQREGVNGRDDRGRERLRTFCSGCQQTQTSASPHIIPGLSDLLDSEWCLWIFSGLADISNLTSPASLDSQHPLVSSLSLPVPLELNQPLRGG